jgi:L-fuculose-phosphate aldolase
MTFGLPDNYQTRTAIIEACRWMNSSGINQGTSGNISVRTGEDGNDMIITPSGIPYADLEPDMLVRMPLDMAPKTGEGWLKPSSEWRFHQALLRTRRDMHAVVHAHPTYASALAIVRESIPACHYMIAAFGGHDVPLADYHLFGSVELADEICDVMKNRHGCLMANHGATVLGESLEKAIWRLEELENLAHVYTVSRQLGTPHILNLEEMDEVIKAFANYGPVKAEED